MYKCGLKQGHMIPLLVGPRGLCVDPLKAWLVQNEELRKKEQQLVSIQESVKQRLRLLKVKAAFDAWETLLNPWAWVL